MSEARYNRLDNQSPTQTQLENTDIKVGRSAFDFSKVTTGNALIGALIPIDCFDVVPIFDKPIFVDLSACKLPENKAEALAPLVMSQKKFYLKKENKNYV